MRMLNRTAAAALVLAAGTLTLTAEDKKGGAKADAKPITDAEFVIKAASGGMFEVESSKLAQGAGDAEVKKFAEQMIADHEKANKELMEVAKKANLGVPTKMLDHHQKMFDDLKAAKGGDLGKAYMKAQVKSHEEAVEVFSSGAKFAKDPGIKGFAEKTLPVIQKHLEHAKKHSHDK